MSKYIIDVGDAYAEYICGKGDMLCLPVRINEFEDNWLNTNIPLTPYTEPDLEQINAEKDKIYDEARARGYEEGKARGYQEGLFDAWQAARKIAIREESGGLTCREMQRIFCTDETDEIFDMSASEAIEKIKAYEQEQEEQNIRYEQIRQGLLGVAKACNAKMQELDEALTKMKEES